MKISVEPTRQQHIGGNRMSSWVAFWIFMAVMWCCESWLFSQGYNTIFHTHLTQEEKEIQQIKIERLRDSREGEK